jgi:putative Mg2+ transporter-C (MgtC) family protein
VVSAAVECQCAGGHVLPALALTAIVLTIHTVPRPLGRLGDQVPAVKTESIAGYMVLVEVRRTYELQLRAQLMQELGKPEVMVWGLAGRAIHNDSDSAATMAQLRVQIEVEGKADALLDGLVGRLSLAPGVGSIRWQHPAIRGGTTSAQQCQWW